MDRLLRYMGAKKVQVVGHSQGGMMLRYWIKYLGGKSKVEDLVGFAPSNYGTNLGEASSQNSTAEDFNLPAANNPEGDNPCYSCDQQGADSSFIKRLNAGDDTPGGGSFSQIASEEDEIIIPFRNCFLKGTERTRNVILQTYYRKYYPTTPPVTHQNIYEDPVAVQFMLDALDNPGTVDPDRALEDFPTTPPHPCSRSIPPSTPRRLERRRGVLGYARRRDELALGGRTAGLKEAPSPSRKSFSRKSHRKAVERMIGVGDPKRSATAKTGTRSPQKNGPPDLSGGRTHLSLAQVSLFLARPPV